MNEVKQRRPFWPRSPIVWAIGVLIAAVLIALFAHWQIPKDHFLIHIIHTTLPIAVIGIEFIVLTRMRKEENARGIAIERLSTTIETVDNFRAALGRQYYLDAIANAIATAEREVVFTTATMRATWQEMDHRQERIIKCVIERFERDKQQGDAKYSHRGLVAKSPRALPGTIELISCTDIDVRMCPVMAMSRLRFVVRDNSLSVIGVAETADDDASQEPSRLSFTLDSAMLALALRDRFEQLWEQSHQTAWDYLGEYISNAKLTKADLCQVDILDWLGAHKSLYRKAIRKRLKECCKLFAELPKSPHDIRAMRRDPQ